MSSFFLRRKAVSMGELDGQNGHPPSNFDGSHAGQVSEFERKIVALAEAEMHGSVEKWKKDVEVIAIEISALESELNTAATNYENLLTHHRRIHGGFISNDPKGRKGVWNYLLLGLLIVAECAVNIYTFQFLREPGAITIVLGLSIGLMIPFSGHLIGTIFKKTSRSLAEIAGAAGLLLISAGLIIVVATGRQEYMEMKQLDASVVTTAFWIFLLLNAAFFLFSFLGGILLGSRHPELQKAYLTLNNRKRQYTDRIGKIKQKFLEGLVEIHRTEARAKELSAIYQAANRGARAGMPAKGFEADGTPLYFGSDFSILHLIKYPMEVKDYLNEKEPEEKYWIALCQTKGMEALGRIKETMERLNRILKG